VQKYKYIQCVLTKVNEMPLVIKQLYVCLVTEVEKSQLPKFNCFYIFWNLCCVRA